MDYINEAAKEALTPPRDYFGVITELQEQGWGQTFGVHRDSDLLEQSNWDAVIEHLQEKFPDSGDYRIEGSNHWAVGWLDTLMVRVLRCECEEISDDTMPFIIRKDDKWYCESCNTFPHYTAIFRECVELRAHLDNYPILDEEDYSRREWEDLSEYVEQEVNSIWNRHHDDDIPEHLIGSVLDRISGNCTRSDDVDYSDLENAVKEEWIKGLIEDAIATNPDQLRMEG